MECNKEHLFRLVDERIAAKICADFESDWAKATPATPSMMHTMMEKYRQRTRAQLEESGDRSESESRDETRRPSSLSRNLTTELDAVAEENQDGTTTKSQVVHYSDELLNKFGPQGDDDDNTT
eukprot:6507128-Karenia_brevis.AAC.1